MMSVSCDCHVTCSVVTSHDVTQSLTGAGTLVHQEDPLLADLFFIDPQWLCDLFAHVVTIRDVNAFIHKGEGCETEGRGVERVNGGVTGAERVNGDVRGVGKGEV